MDKSKLPEPLGIMKLTVPDGNTEDIVSEILRVYKKYKHQFKDFAQGFQVPCKCPEKVAAKIWYWLKANIRYQRDPKGKQYIKSPAITVQQGYGDCKTLSIITMSILHHLGIKAYFRFTSYNPDKPLHHVYVVIPHGNQEILIDAVWYKFNQEKKPIIKKRDIMPDIYEVAGVEGIGEIGEIASIAEQSKDVVRQELTQMRDFISKYSLNEVEKQTINNVLDTYGTTLWNQTIDNAIQNSEMKLFYRTVKDLQTMLEAPSKSEIGVLPLAAGLAAGKGAIRFLKNGGLKKIGKAAKGIFKKGGGKGLKNIVSKLKKNKDASPKRRFLGKFVDKVKSKIKQIKERNPNSNTSQEQAQTDTNVTEENVRLQPDQEATNTNTQQNGGTKIAVSKQSQALTEEENNADAPTTSSNNNTMLMIGGALVLGFVLLK